ncbi:MAG: DUF4190 domain-containing protein [Acidobacteria bacterium]|nr:DUF4190 domain-containing protein [Acidobacteriota bacterium]
MKTCPRCGKQYTEPGINFCLEDGELLSHLQESRDPSLFADDQPPTMIMDSPRATRETNWPTMDPIMPYSSPVVQFPQHSALSPISQSKDQTLPIVSMALGVASLILVCCYGGIWLGLPAAAVGFMAMRNADRDPDRYGGSGLAIAGLIIGIVTFIISMLFIFLGIVAQIS